MNKRKVKYCDTEHCIARPCRRSDWARWTHRAVPCMANSTGCFVDACPAPHTWCVQPGRFTGRTLEPLCCVGTAPGDTFTGHLGARCISGTRSRKHHQPSFTTPQLGIASSQLAVPLTSRWKNCLYSPLQEVFPLSMEFQVALS